jgi:beta-phosphoglucomutase
MIRAVVFDMDGVLIEAKDWHYDALNRALGLFGYEIPRADHLNSYDGLPTAMKLELLSADNGLPVGLHAFINEMKQLFTVEMVHVLCKPRFVHQFALSRLQADGFKIAVASNSIGATVQLMMDKADLARYLDVCLSTTDVDRPKPFPDIYLEAARQLGVEPTECLVVEDNDHGVAAAQAAGCKVLRVDSTDDVSYSNIMAALNKFSEANA